MANKDKQWYIDNLLKGGAGEPTTPEQDKAFYDSHSDKEPELKLIAHDRGQEYLPLVEHHKYNLNLEQWKYDEVRSKLWNDGIKQSLENNDWYELELSIYRTIENKEKVETMKDIDWEQDKVILHGIPKSLKPEDYFRTSTIRNITEVGPHLWIKTTNSVYAFNKYKE